MKMSMLIFLTTVIFLSSFSNQNFFSFLMMIEMLLMLFIFLYALEMTMLNQWIILFWYLITTTLTAIAGIFVMTFSSRLTGNVSFSFFYD